MRNILTECLLGLALGDALGVPFEFKERHTFKCKGMVGFGSWNKPAGTWSDDTSMTVCLIDSLNRRGHLERDDLMLNFMAWLDNGAFTAGGECFDVGNTCQRAIERYRRGAKVNECGCRNLRDNGNGALMRILPYCLLPPKKRTVPLSAVVELTHAHPMNIQLCDFYDALVQELLNKHPLPDAINQALSLHPAAGSWISDAETLASTKEDDIRSSAYIVDTLNASLWCLMTTDNYHDAVIKAVNLGGDTDTTASVSGGLAALLYHGDPKKGIFEKWLKTLLRRDFLEQLADECYQRLFV